ETLILYHDDITKLYVGLGKEDEVDAEVLRNVSSTAFQRLKRLKKTNFSLFFPEVKNIEPKDVFIALCEGILLSDYNFDKYKSEKKENVVESIEIITDHDFTNEIKTVSVICNAVNYARDLVNENANEITPERLAKEAKVLSVDYNLNLEVLNEDKIKEKGLNMITAVGQGASTPPRLIVMEYIGDGKNSQKTAIVGKGVTFDSGGINLKPSNSIETMRQDMSGAAAVLGIMKAIAELKLKCNVIGVIGAVANAIGPDAFMPGDIVKSYNGKTVQVKNTDAEGRLVLADSLAYTVKNYKPSQIVDFATLTGAIKVCFGDFIAGIFSNNDELSTELFNAGERTYERLWRMPLYKEFCEAMEGETADLNNLSNLSRGDAGSITAAAFLQEFVDKTPWAHIDIAGTAFNERKVRGYIPKNATGYGVRLILDWLMSK
ncbi:leucyl aminopeptidase, partial [bacterium]|nr:leucyl aminopeptidase [bacterium]